MTSSLTRIPPRRRRSAAATLGLVAALLTAVGTVAATGASTASLQVFVALTLLVALLLALVAWGLAYSVRLDTLQRSEQQLDDAVMAVVREQPGQLCSCGHEHDPTELHITDAEPDGAVCHHDGAGEVCSHDCDTCVLAALRPSPTATRSERLRR